MDLVLRQELTKVVCLDVQSPHRLNHSLVGGPLTVEGPNLTLVVFVGVPFTSDLQVMATSALEKR